MFFNYQNPSKYVSSYQNAIKQQHPRFVQVAHEQLRSSTVCSKTFYHCCSCSLLVPFSWNLLWFLVGVSMEFLWDSKKGCLTVVPIFLKDFVFGILWDFYVQMVWNVYVMSMVFLLDVYGISIGFLWCFYGISMGSLWNFFGMSKRFLCKFYGISMIC